MANNTSNLQERMSEARATAEAQSVIRILNDKVMEPSTKRFIHGRSARLASWQQIEAIAKAQVAGLQGLSRQCAVPRKAKARPLSEVPIDRSAHIESETRLVTPAAAV